MARPCILSIDQGTTSSRAIAFDATPSIVALAQREFPQIYPAPGLVEHDPEAIWSTTLEVASEVAAAVARRGFDVAAIGITNQRETTVVWDRETGRPIHNAIVWQDRRTAEACERLRAAGLEPEIHARTGLLIDPYFSASKLRWLLDTVDGARAGAETGRLAFGTIDTFLIWRLTEGTVHATDPTNACRTGLYNIHEMDWDDELLRIYDVPHRLLPEVRDCDADFGVAAARLIGTAVPIRGVAGDQQAAAIGQCCFRDGDIKCTFGTGSFVVLNTGERPVASRNRLLTTVGSRIAGTTQYALEGSIFVAGAAVQWLRDGLGVIDDAAQTERLAAGLADNGGVYLVPAFTGLGAPHWRADVRGAIFGLTRDSGPAQLARAALEAVGFQTHDLLRVMAEDGVKPVALKVDGGMAANDWFVRFLAGVLDLPVDRPRIVETTALGAAYLAGRGAGVFGSREQFADEWQREARFEPAWPRAERERLLAGWRESVDRLLYRPPPR
ncbi:MAG TPA: glycerol kinase GlpK [Candidatus Polarisedimenticolaceae bacterium]|nr:glycerol kinase GlpK [Candidatus Polarisedimenticolaceae bacterium]